jgi:hypothetical protein
MLKTKSVLHVKINDRNYCLYCECDSPLGELHDALVQMKTFVIQTMQNAEKPKEEPT